jgi:hypothetical protein
MLIYELVGTIGKDEELAGTDDHGQQVEIVQEEAAEGEGVCAMLEEGQHGGEATGD